MQNSDANKKEKVRVLMLVPFFGAVGGSEIQAFNLAKKLKIVGADSTIVTYGDGRISIEDMEGVTIHGMYSLMNRVLAPFEKRKPAVKPVKIEYNLRDETNFIVAGKKSLFSLIPGFVFLLNILIFLRKKRKDFDVIYSPTIEWTAVVAMVIGKLWKRKVVIKDSTMNGIFNLIRYPFGRKLQRLVIKNCYFVAMTKVIELNYLNAGVPQEKIFKIPNGVELPSDIKRFKSRNIFVFVGNLYQQPAKGVDILLKSWKIVIEKMPDAFLRIIGKGNTSEYYDYIKKLGISENVEFLGRRSDIKEQLLQASCFILPSRREGMSNALLEAMSFGMPCIATDISGNQDLIRNGSNGILVPVEDEVALAKAIQYMYENPEHALAMGEDARNTIKKWYTLESVATGYYDLFRSLSRR